MTTYELYSDETQLSTDFNQDFVLLEDESMVQFTILEDEDYKNKKASYTYHVRGSGITESDDYVLDAEAHIFTTVCSPEIFVVPEIDEATAVQLDGTVPVLKFPQYTSYS